MQCAGHESESVIMFSSCFLSLILYNVWADEPLDWSYALMRVFPPQRFEASWQPFNSFSQSPETAVEFHASCVLLLKGRLGHLVLISACHVTWICPPRLLVNTPISNFPLLKVLKVIPLVSFNAIVISIGFEGEGILSETPTSRHSWPSQGRKGRVPRWAFGEMASWQANLGRKPELDGSWNHFTMQVVGSESGKDVIF